ncbi:MAG: peptidyl-prolyl cis-trans isomerase [Bacteroidota bacterium]
MLRQHTDIIRCSVVILLFAFITGCSKEPESRDYVARVGTAVLTQNAIDALRDSIGNKHLRTQDFINEWITSEMLYQEAARRGLADSENLRQQIESIRRRLAIEALLQDDVYSADTSSVSEDIIATVYAAGGPAFLLREDVVSASYAFFVDRDVANAFRSNLLRGVSWPDALLAVQQDSLQNTQLLQVATRQYFARSTLYPEELWKLARNLTAGDVSFVLKTDTGYHVLVLHGLKQKGEMPDLDYIRNEIRDRLLIEQRRLRYEQLLEQLRKEQPVEVRSVPEDSVTTHNDGSIHE